MANYVSPFKYLTWHTTFDAMSIQSQVANGYYITHKVNISNYNYTYFKDNLITYCSFLLKLNEPLGTKWLVQSHGWVEYEVCTTNFKVEKRYILRGITPSYTNAYTCAQDLFIGGYLSIKLDYKVWLFSK